MDSVPHLKAPDVASLPEPQPLPPPTPIQPVSGQLSWITAFKRQWNGRATWVTRDVSQSTKPVLLCMTKGCLLNPYLGDFLLQAVNKILHSCYIRLSALVTGTWQALLADSILAFLPVLWEDCVKLQKSALVCF